MPPLQLQATITISDDEDSYGSGPQAVSRDLEDLERKIEEINEQVTEFDADVASYTRLLKAAEDRLEKSSDQRDELVDEKNRLVERKRRLLQRKRKRAIKAQPPATPSTASDFKAAKGQTTGSRILTVPSASLPGAVENQAIKDQNTATEHRATESRTPISLNLDDLGAAESQVIGSRTTATEGRTTEGRTTEGRTVTAPDGFGSGPGASECRTAQGQSFATPNGFGSDFGAADQVIDGRTTATIRRDTENRTPAAPTLYNSKATPKTTRTANRVYSPYYEASNTDSEEPVTVSQLPPGDRLNIPAHSKSFSRLEISSLIGGKTQGTWCNVGPNRATGYKAGSYMALVRDLNHLLPMAPGMNGGVYVGDWLKKEVGKAYHIFIKRTTNNWRYYGKYMISSIREVSLDEWKKFSRDDQNRWAEHLLEHQWGKNILVKKKVFKSAENLCVKANWKEVLRFFNQPDDLPHLRLKLLGLHFIAYDRGLYDGLESQTRRVKSEESNVM